ncbi:MAG TPA: hypothetical protein VG246_05455 [Acidimicrobiales bacterium]|jgi:hypothetical protein|nr:hypothetical protein [Acidimicrobiales bacterium]
MDAETLAALTAEPMQVLGMSFYFDPLTQAAGKELGLNVYEFYGLGRAGTLGDVGTETVQDVFYFFHPSVIDFVWTNAKAKADPIEIAKEHVRAAYAFAERTFGGVDPSTLSDFATAVRRMVELQDPGVCPLVDGYLAFPAPSDPLHTAYLATIFLRELRGGLHIYATREVGLEPIVACYLQDPGVFALHGYKEDDAPSVNDELVNHKSRAEELTNTAMAACFAVLSDEERRAVAVATPLMFNALKHPVPVAG